MATDKNNNLVFPGATSVGLRNVGSYQVSGMPWITGSTNLDTGKVHMVEFPYVTSRVTVRNSSMHPDFVDATKGVIRVHFQSGSGVTAVTVPGDSGAQTIAAGSDVIRGFHYFPLAPRGRQPSSGSAAPPDTLILDVKCTKLYVSNLSGVSNLSYQVVGELTNIPTSRMPHLTGSGITET